jgi:hypothetical protein
MFGQFAELWLPEPFEPVAPLEPVAPEPDWAAAGAVAVEVVPEDELELELAAFATAPPPATSAPQTTRAASECLNLCFMQSPPFSFLRTAWSEPPAPALEARRRRRRVT